MKEELLDDIIKESGPYQPPGLRTNLCTTTLRRLLDRSLVPRLFILQVIKAWAISLGMRLPGDKTCSFHLLWIRVGMR